MSNTCRWVEFTKKSVAKRVANMLNGEHIGMQRNLVIIISETDHWAVQIISFTTGRTLPKKFPSGTNSGDSSIYRRQMDEFRLKH